MKSDQLRGNNPAEGVIKRLGACCSINMQNLICVSEHQLVTINIYMHQEQFYISFFNSRCFLASVRIWLHRPASYSIREHPALSWGIPLNPTASVSIWLHLPASYSIREYPAESWGILLNPTESYCICKHLVTSSSILQHQRVSYSILRHLAESYWILLHL